MATDLQNRPETDSGSDAGNPAQSFYDREFAGLTDPEHFSKDAVSPEELESRESGATAGSTSKSEGEGGVSDTLGAGYSAISSGSRAGSALGALSLIRSSRKKKGVAGIVSLIVGILIILGISSGPLEFVHISQLLHDAHFSQQENAGDSRMSKLYRYARSGGKTGSRRVGETRLGTLGSKYHARIVSELEAIGITPEYEKLDIYKGMSIDTTHENSPYKGKTPEEAAKIFEEKTGIKPTIEGDHLKVNADKFWGQKKSINSTLKELKTSKVTTAVRSRVLRKFGLVDWHPLHKADKFVARKGITAYEAFKESRDAKLKNRVQNTVDGTGAKITDDTTDPKNPKTTAIPGESGSATSSGAKKTLGDIKSSGSFKVAGGVAAAVGLICIAKTVDDHVGEIRYAQVIVPLMRVGMDAIAVGNQIMSGQDVDAQQVSYLSKSFSEIDSSGQKTNWNEAKSLRAATGQEGGIDMDAQDKQLISQGKPGWLSWTQSGTVGALCSKAGQVITGAVSIVVGVLSGGTVSTAASLVAGILAGPFIVDKLADLVSGNAVNLARGGAAWGNQINFGSALGANAAALSFGAGALSPSESAQLNNEAAAERNQDFASKSTLQKLFDVHDYRSVASQVIDKQNPDVTQNVASIFSSFTHIGSYLVSLPATLLSAKAKAAPSLPYDYGFPQYGFSQADLNNPTMNDPYANADSAATLLDIPCEINGLPHHPCGQDYIDKAGKCFGVDISKGADGWDAIPGRDINIYDEGYDKSGCAGAGDQNWKVIRFFILDTGVMTGYACANLDDEQACGASGIGGGSAAAPAPAPAPTAIVNPATGDAQQLAKTILANKNIQLSGRLVASDIQAAANDKEGSAGAKTSAAILRLISTVGATHTVVITAIQSGGTGHCQDTPKSGCPNDPHYTGDAVDFGAIDGKTLTGRDGGSLSILQTAFTVLPSGAGFGQKQCGATPPLPAGDTTYNDTCTHLHIDVPAGTP
jgi:hypothetical protein